MQMDMAGVVMSRLSAREIMMVSRNIFNELSSQQCINLSTVQKFFDSAQFDLSDGEIKDVELAVMLIACAQKVSDKHFDEARRLHNLCDFLSSSKGNSIQRVVHYFTKALQERIDRERGTISSKSKARKVLLHPCEPTGGIDPALASRCLQLPCVQICQFAAIQALTDNLASAKKVHIIDLAIISGVHCPVLMQALVNRHDCPVELVKLTAVAIPETKQKIEEIGKCLTCLAQTLNLPFSFCTVEVSDIKDLEKGMFEISDDEAAVVLAFVVLRNIRALPDSFKSVFRFFKNLNPCVLVIIEPEADHSSPIFMDRFHESLLFYSSFYECIDACVSQGDPYRIAVEAMVGQELRNIVAAEDEERIFRHMKIDEWREYFVGFGMVEIEISMLSFDHATLLLKKFSTEESCLLERNGKCLVTGWKGTPLVSVSAWKFQQGKSNSLFVGKKAI